MAREPHKRIELPGGDYSWGVESGAEYPQPGYADSVAPEPSAASIAEDEFREWYAFWASKYNLNPNPDDPRHYYDYRAAFRAGAKPDSSGHWPSKFKIEGHPNEVVDGVNTRTGKASKIPPWMTSSRGDKPKSTTAGTTRRLTGVESKGFAFDSSQPVPEQGGTPSPFMEQVHQIYRKDVPVNPWAVALGTMMRGMEKMGPGSKSNDLQSVLYGLSNGAIQAGEAYRESTGVFLDEEPTPAGPEGKSDATVDAPAAGPTPSEFVHFNPFQSEFERQQEATFAAAADYGRAQYGAYQGSIAPRQNTQQPGPAGY